MPLFGPPNIEKLKAKGNTRGLIRALGYEEDAKICRAAAEALDTLGWQPDQGEAGALYWVAKRQWNKCAEIGEPSVQPLVDVLNTTDKNLRQAAVKALGQIGAPAMQPLIASLEDADKDIRQIASDALEAIGQPAIELLIATLEKKKWCMQDRAPRVADFLSSFSHDDLFSLSFNISALRRVVKDHSWQGLIMSRESMAELSQLEVILANAMAAIQVYKEFGEKLSPFWGARSVDYLKSSGDVEGLIEILGYKQGQAVREATGALVALGAPAMQPLIAAYVDRNTGWRVQGRASRIADLDKVDKHALYNTASALKRIVDNRSWQGCVVSQDLMSELSQVVAALKPGPLTKP